MIPAATRLAVVTTAGVVVVDQLTKQWALVALNPRPTTIDLPGPLHFRLTFNDGGPFGLPLPSWTFLAVTVLVAVLVVAQLPHVRSRAEAIAYGLLFGGALGNGVDRIFRRGDTGDPAFGFGHVVDFIASDFFPTFNVADVAINLGFVALLFAVVGQTGADDDDASEDFEPVPIGNQDV